MNLYNELDNDKALLVETSDLLSTLRAELTGLDSQIKDKELELANLKASQEKTRASFNSANADLRTLQGNIQYLEDRIKEYEFNKAVDEFVSVQIDFFEALESRIKHHQEYVNVGLVDLDTTTDSKSVVEKIKSLISNNRFPSELNVVVTNTIQSYKEALKAIGILKVKGSHIDANARKQPQAVLDALIFRDDVQKLWIQ